MSSDPDRSTAGHWDAVYAERGSTGVSWYEADPTTSLQLIDELAVARNEPVIDVGGGASFLVDRLLDRGHTDVTVLDISDTSLEEARARVGDRPGARWIVEDLLAWSPTRTYGLWHDRAVFHFLVDDADRERYHARLEQALRPGGAVVMATFAPDGPEHCSGLPVRRHSPADLAAFLGAGIVPVAERREVHTTPAGVCQPFTWLAARRAGGSASG